MKIIMRDEREFTGTPEQIVKQMQFIAFAPKAQTLSDYIDWVVANALRGEEIALDVRGANDAERCAALIDEMLRTGLCRRG